MTRNRPPHLSQPTDRRHLRPRTSIRPTQRQRPPARVPRRIGMARIVERVTRVIRRGRSLVQHLLRGPTARDPAVEGVADVERVVREAVEVDAQEGFVERRPEDVAAAAEPLAYGEYVGLCAVAGGRGGRPGFVGGAGVVFVLGVSC